MCKKLENLPNVYSYHSNQIMMGFLNNPVFTKLLFCVPKIEQRSRDFDFKHPVKEPGNGFLIRVFRTMGSPGGSSHPCSTFLRPSYTEVPQNTPSCARSFLLLRMAYIVDSIVIFLSHNLLRYNKCSNAEKRKYFLA